MLQLTLITVSGYAKRQMDCFFLVLSRIARHEVQLETFALYIMFVNFCERDNPLNPIFDEYSDTSLYFDKIDLLKLISVTDDIEAEMMNLAYKTISELKG